MLVDEIELGVKEAVIRTIFVRLFEETSNNLTSRTRLTGIYTSSSADLKARDAVKPHILVCVLLIDISLTGYFTSTLF